MMQRIQGLFGLSLPYSKPRLDAFATGSCLLPPSLSSLPGG
jgi:hypothetical protein